MSEVPEPEQIPPPFLEEGSFFDKYRIIRLIGRGGMSEVYLAEHILLKQTYALKILPQTSERESGLYKRFIREARCFHLLEHKNIVRVYEAGCDSATGCLFIAMEYIDGVSLAELDKKEISCEKLLQIALDVASALVELEKNGIVHRDIKPSNIMMSRDGVCKLMDLGIAKNNTSTCENITITGEHYVFGTPAFASPEQCCSPHKADTRSDIYSLGATLYCLACGEAPYEGKTPVEIIAAIRHEEPVPLEKFKTSLPRSVIRFIRMMMAKSPLDRPANARVLLEKIRSLQQGKSSESPGKRAGRFLRGLVIAAGILAAAGCGGYFYLKSGLSPAVPCVTSFFHADDFIPGNSPLTPADRLKICRRCIAWLEKEDRTAFKVYRLQMFRRRERLLLKLAAQKAEKKHFSAFPAEGAQLSRELQLYLDKRKQPFYGSRKDVVFGRKIAEALRSSHLDPRLVYTVRGRKMTVAGCALAGWIVPVPEVLDAALDAGADADQAFCGEPLVLDVRLEKKLYLHVLERLLAAGAGKVVRSDGKALLPSVFSALPTVCAGNWSNFTDHLRIAELLVDGGYPIDAVDEMGRSAAHFAAASESQSLLRKLLLAGCRGANQPDKQGMTPWHYAVRNNASDCQRMLKKGGLDVPDVPADHASGELLLAIYSGDHDLAKKALDAGASPDFVYANQFNALQNAVLHRRGDIVKLLLERGADPNVRHRRGNCFVMASCAGEADILNALLERNPRPERFQQLPRIILCHHRSDARRACELFNALLKVQWDINSVPSRDVSALHRASVLAGTDPGIIEFLLKNGADPRGSWRRRIRNPRIRRLLDEALEKRQKGDFSVDRQLKKYHSHGIFSAVQHFPVAGKQYKRRLTKWTSLSAKHLPMRRNLPPA